MIHVRAPREKSGALLCLTLASWFCASLWSWTYFAVTVPASYGPVAGIALRLLHLPWMLFWLWGIHNFWHQTLSLLPRVHAPELCAPPDVEVAILYTTRDDFDPEACRSCLQQSHPNTRLIICDDSSDELYKRRIDDWAVQFEGRVIVARRPDRRGFKAGNLNWAITNLVSEEFILVCDADELIPPDFIVRLLPHVQVSDVAFAQARHRVRYPAETRFAELLGPAINMFYEHCLPLRNRFGFVSCFGHGVIIRRSVWRAIGGFPEIVSEDLGFASRAVAAGFRGTYVEDVVAEEAFPPSYTAFLRKYRRVVGGTIQYFNEEYPRLLRSPLATLTEKLDVLLTFSSCLMGIVAMVNLVGGMALVYVYKLQGYDRLELWLLLLYLIGPLTPIAPLIVNLRKEPKRYAHFLCAAAIAYASLLPMLALKGLEQILKLSAPNFEPTGRAWQNQRLSHHVVTQVSGLLVLGFVAAFRSQAFIPATGIALMFVLGPLMCFSERSDRLGVLARNCGFIPFATMIVLLLSWQ